MNKETLKDTLRVMKEQELIINRVLPTEQGYLIELKKEIERE